MKKVILATLTAAAMTAIPTTTAQAQDCFLGEVRLFAGNFAPRSFAKAEGQLLSIAQNSALFSILGTMYGGDGRTTFALPDMRPIQNGHANATGGQKRRKPTENYVICVRGYFPSRN